MDVGMMMAFAGHSWENTADDQVSGEGTRLVFS